MTEAQLASLRQKVANQHELSRRLAPAINRQALQRILQSSLLALGGGGLFAHLTASKAPSVSELDKYEEARRVELEPRPAVKKAFSRPSTILDNPRATTVEGVPGYVLASALLPALAGLAGWSSVAGYHKKRHKLQNKQRLETAKQDYEAALSGLPAKEASADEMLDTVYDVVMTKKANPYLDMIPDWLISPDVKGNALGNYLLYAAATAPMGYFMVDKAMQGSNRSHLLNKAIRERERRHSAAQPNMLHATVKRPLAIEDKSDEEREDKQRD